MTDERPRIINESALDRDEESHGFTSIRRKQLGGMAGGERLGCSLYELPPARNRGRITIIPETRRRFSSSMARERSE